jgi:hypothetical protein
VPTVTIVDDEKRTLFHHPDEKFIQRKVKGGRFGCDSGIY